jgi:hypothetical protein
MKLRLALVAIIFASGVPAGARADDNQPSCNFFRLHQQTSPQEGNRCSRGTRQTSFASPLRITQTRRPAACAVVALMACVGASRKDAVEDPIECAENSVRIVAASPVQKS